MSDRMVLVSQVDRVLALLRSQGETGVNTSSLQEIPVLDGGAPILRLAARIQQLKDRGYSISSRREANRTSTYFLVSDGPVVSAACGTGDVPESERATTPRTIDTTHVAPLFDTSRFTERGGYRDAERAA